MKHTHIPAAAAACLILTGICGSVPQGAFPGISAFTAYAQAQSEGDYEYEIIGANAAVITRYLGKDEEIVIPEKLGGVPVAAIEDDAFRNKGQIKKLTLPEAMTRITFECFQDCVNLEEVQISSSTEFLSGTFRGCTSLRAINLPDTLLSLGQETFKDCKSLTEIHIPENVESIAKEVFSGCENLKTIEIPETVFYFGSDAFTGTAWLKDRQKENPVVIVDGIVVDGSACEGAVVIPPNTETVSEAAFRNNDLLTGITFPESLTTIKNEAFSGCSGLTKLTIPSTLRYIEYDAFSDCENLKTVSLPNNLQSIGMEAFSGCLALKKIKLPQQLSNIPEGLFSGCKNLTDIEFPEWSFYAQRDAFKDTAWLAAQQAEDPCVVYDGTLIDVSACEGTLILPETVERIGRWLFYRNEKLTKVVFPESYTTLDEGLLLSCPNLREVVFLAKETTKIPCDMIANCSRLERVTLPETYYVIGFSAFERCDHLTSIYIPETVLRIDESAFLDCPNLIIEGKKGSYAEQYAEKNKIPFRVSTGPFTPDLDGDGKCTLSDVEVLQTYLLNSFTPLANWQYADLNNDGVLTAVDLTMLKQYILRYVI